MYEAKNGRYGVLARAKFDPSYLTADPTIGFFSVNFQLQSLDEQVTLCLLLFIAIFKLTVIASETARSAKLDSL